MEVHLEEVEEPEDSSRSALHKLCGVEGLENDPQPIKNRSNALCIRIRKE